MSAFRVFGTSRKQIYEQLYKKSAKRNNESIEEFDARMQAEADSVFAQSNSVKPVSEKCDAPCFCRDFIDMANPKLFKNLEIRVNAFNGKIDPITKQPKFSWIKYEEGKDYSMGPR